MKYFVTALLMFSAGVVFSQDSLLPATDPMIGDSCRIRFSGHVEDADTKEKLVGATVSLSGLSQQIITDDKGDFVFAGVCAGQYTLLITHVDCAPLEQAVTITRDRHADYFLPHALNTLGEVVVAGRTGMASSGFKQDLSGRRLEETKGLSLAEALSKINGVTMLQMGTNIAKPVIHGLHSSRILTINNGVRQEGQQWGNEHAPEIDPFIADKLTVIKGVDELRYGSDAIGGVMLIQPRPLRSRPGYNLEVNTGYFTNNRQYYLSAIYEQQLKKLPAFTYRLQGTYKKGANAATPDYRLNNTGSEEKNFSVTLAWKKQHFTTELFYSLFSTQAGIFIGSHIGNFADLEKAIAADRPDEVYLGQDTYRIGRPYQDVTHQLLKSKSQWLLPKGKLNFQIAGQFNNRKEYDVTRSSSNTRPQLNLSISTFSEDLNWEHKPQHGFSGVVGLAAMQQDNAYAGRYLIPNYRAYTYGAYAIEKWERHAWELQAGLRYDYKTISTDRMLQGADTTFAQNSFDFSTYAASFNTGYRISERWKVNLNLSLSTRAPYVNELLIYGIHHGTATFEIGDINFKAEQAFNTGISTGYHNRKGTLVVDLDFYHNRINDFIYQQPVPDEPVLTIAGAFRRTEYRQADATLTGMDASVLVKPMKDIEWTSRASILRARNRQLDDWLILMPSDRISTEVLYRLPVKGRMTDTYLSGEIQQVFRQTRVPGDKNGPQDYKAAPDGYALVNLNASTTIGFGNTPVSFSVGVRNLFDRSYRDYMDAMRYFADAMGRNISFRIRVPLEGK
ncbi:MAG: TonB-dependent receptor [Chitinophagaceae bacterium]|nr:MAG: TonB-dependent receptor [Chitinophagaceae bacterium]